MDGLPDMHDGFFDGLWTSENKNAYLFLRTYTGGRSTLVLKDLERIDVSNFKAGSIILDVVFVDSGELTIEHIQQLYQFSDSGKAQQFLTKAQERGLRVARSQSVVWCWLHRAISDRRDTAGTCSAATNGSAANVVDENRWDEKAGLRRDAVGSQVIDVLEAQEINETGNEEG
jgi:hypothetical protein